MFALNVIPRRRRKHTVIFSSDRLKTLAGHGLTIFALLCFSGLIHAQMIDLNQNGMSDIWEQFYNAQGLPPNGDADGDSVSNLKESLAGTDPFDPASFPQISSFAQNPTNFSVTFPCQLGKVYQLQSITDMGSSNWQLETGVVVRAGTTLTLTAPNGSSG